MSNYNNNIINSIRCIGNVSKLSSKLSIGVAKNHKVIETTTEIDYSVCNNCSIYKAYKQQESNKEREDAIESCRSNCPLVIKEKNKITYINEKNRLKLDEDPGDLTLPKIPLKLYLLLHFMPEIDSDGLVRRLSIVSMANTIKCTTKSIRRALNELQEKGYIIYSEAGSIDRVNIVVLSYKDNYLTKEEGGTGYIKIPNTVLIEILNATNINYIRLIMRLLFIESKNNPNRGNLSMSNDNVDTDTFTKRRSFVTYDEIKSYLPDYMNSEPAIIQKLSNLEDVFYIEFLENKVIFETRDSADFVSVKSDAELEALLEFMPHEDYITGDDAVELTNLSLRYGLQATKEAFSEAMMIYKDKFKEKVENVAGLITTIIRNNQILALI